MYQDFFVVLFFREKKTTTKKKNTLKYLIWSYTEDL